MFSALVRRRAPAWGSVLSSARDSVARRTLAIKILPGGPGCKPGPEACAKCGHFPCASLMRKEFAEKKPFYRKGGFWLGVFIAAYGIGNVERLPISHRYRLRLVPEFVDHRIARDYDARMMRLLADKFLSPDSPEHKLVEQVGSRIAAANGIENLEFHVVQDDTEVNAFVTAGGKVVVYTGILQHLQTPERLAVILGHEIAHYVADHVAERKGIDWINMVLSEALEAKDSKWFHYLSTVGLTLPKSRAVETEADFIGLMLMARAHFDPRWAGRVWTEFAMRAEVDPYPEASSSSKAMSGASAAAQAHILSDTRPVNEESVFDRYLSTHPSHRERIERFDERSIWMKQALQLYEDKAAVPSESPHPVRWWILGLRSVGLPL